MNALVAALWDREGRPEAADRLACALGVEGVLIFTADPELGTMLPGLGFPQTLRGGRRWRALVAEALQAGRAEAAVDFGHQEHAARAYATSDGTVLVLLGEPQAAVEPVLELLPLLGALLRSERTAEAARQREAVSMQTAQESQTLARGLDATRAQLQATLRELRAATEAAETANRSKSLFLANMSHELRTPLHGILGMLELMEHGVLNAQQVSDLDVIRTCCTGLLVIIEDILDFSRIEARRVDLDETPFVLEEVMRNVAAVHRKTALDRGLLLHFDAPVAPPGAVVGDPHRLSQVLHNLLSNAVKFTKAGAVALVLAGCQPEDGRVRVRLEVRDTGIGIAPDCLPTLFEPFRQADSSTTRVYGGSGLGLSISRQLVQLMEGQLGVESELGRGSTFWVEVPLRLATPEEVAATEPPDRSPIPSLHVLLAEDNPVNQQVMSRLLVRGGHRVLLARDGLEAVETWAHHQVDLVLMDVQMPRLDGLEAIRAIREREAAHRQPRTVIAALTAGASLQDREDCYAAGADHYLPKPVPAAALERVLRAVANRAAAP